MSVVQYPVQIALNSPLAYWRFGESSGASCADSSGNGKTMTLSGSYTRNVAELLFNPTVADKALSFTSGAGTATTVINTSAGITVSMMIKFSTVGSDQTIFEAGTFNSATVGYHKLIYRTSGQQLTWYFNKSTGAGFNNRNYAWTPVIGQTYHLAVTQDYTAGTVSFYIDGLLVDSQTPTTGAFGLINQNTDFFSGFSGTIDELAIFNSALSASAIASQFAASRGADSSLDTYYADPAGSTYGRGTSSDPVDLATGLSWVFSGPGKTLLLKDGAYTGVFTVSRSGTAANYFVIKPENRLGATVDGAGLSGHVFNLTGNYIHLRKLEIRKTWATRETTTVDTSKCPIPGTNGTVWGVGVNDAGDHNIVSDNIIHDVLGDGIDSFSAATNSEYYGNLIFNNGWWAPRILGGDALGNGHSFYTQNTEPSVKNITKNMSVNAYSACLKAAGSGASYTHNVNMTGNVLVNGTSSYDVGGGDVGLTNVVLTNERIFNNGLALGYNTTANVNVSLIDSYIYGGELPLQITDFNNIVMTGNTVIGQGGSSGIITARIQTGHNYNESTVDNNTYYYNRANQNNQFFYSNTTGGSLNVTTFAGWKSTTGWDAHSTQITNGTALTKPTTNKIIVERVDKYEVFRGYVAIYNWEAKSIESVDLSSFLNPGAGYEIRSALNYFGGVIASGNYSGNVTLPLTLGAGLPAQALPYGDSARNTDPSPNFALFVIEPTGTTPIGAPGQPTALGATRISNTQINLAWTLGSGTPTSVTLERSTDQSTWTPTTLAANAISYSDTGRTEGLVYYYRVKSTNATGDSLYSDVVSRVVTGLHCYGAGPTVQ